MRVRVRVGAGPAGAGRRAGPRDLPRRPGGLTNVVRHAGARSVELSLARVVGGVLLRVADDGRGITPREAAGDAAGSAGCASGRC